MSLLLLYRGLTAGGDGGGGGKRNVYHTPKQKRRFFVKHDDQLFAFKSKREAVLAVRQIELNKVVTPQELVSFPIVKEYAKLSGKIDAYNAAYE